MDRTSTLAIALVTTTTLREDSLTCDPALNLDDENAGEALSAYLASRAPEHLAALPLRGAMALSLFDVAPLGMSALRYCKGATDLETRVHRTVACACHRVVDGAGVEHLASKHGKMVDSGDRKFKIASDEWLQHVADRYGAAALYEIAEVALTRAEAPPRSLAPFVSPPGAVLPR